MGSFGVVAVLMLAGWAALNPAVMSWAYLAAVGLFEAWLLRRLASGREPVSAGEPPYEFTDEEAALVGRYRFYFTYPGVARHAASVLAAVGLSALLLAPWLTMKQQFVPAVLIGVNLFAVARFTRALAPLVPLRAAASKGDRDALRALELHDPLWVKILAANRRSSGAASDPSAG